MQESVDWAFVKSTMNEKSCKLFVAYRNSCSTLECEYQIASKLRTSGEAVSHLQIVLPEIVLIRLLASIERSPFRVVLE